MNKQLLLTAPLLCFAGSGFASTSITEDLRCLMDGQNFPISITDYSLIRSKQK